MNGIHSLWTETPAFRLDRGRAIIHTLSFCLMAQIFQHTELVTDRCGLEIADRLGWQYSHYVLALDNLVPARSRHIWALGKLRAISLQTQPFCHLDNDVLLFKPLPTRITRAKLFAQNKDNPAYYYGDRMRRAIRESYLIGKISCPYNTGIFGGCAWEAANEYAIRSIAAAARISSEIDGTTASMVVEQRWLGAFAREKMLRIEEHSDAEAAEVGYAHLIGQSKDQPIWQQRCEDRLRRDFPRQYSTFQKGWSKLAA